MYVRFVFLLFFLFVNSYFIHRYMKPLSQHIFTKKSLNIFIEYPAILDKTNSSLKSSVRACNFERVSKGTYYVYWAVRRPHAFHSQELGLELISRYVYNIWKSKKKRRKKKYIVCNLTFAHVVLFITNK